MMEIRIISSSSSFHDNDNHRRIVFWRAENITLKAEKNYVVGMQCEEVVIAKGKNAGPCGAIEKKIVWKVVVV